LASVPVPPCEQFTMLVPDLYPGCSSSPATASALPANSWPRPPLGLEPCRWERPLDLLLEHSAAPAGTWRPLVLDEDRRCYAFLWPRAISSEQTEDYLRRLMRVAPWVELWNTKGTSVTRSTCWYVRGGCTCDYTYGKDTRMENSSACRHTPEREPEDGRNSAAGTPSSGIASSTVCSEEFAAVMHDITAHIFGDLFPGLGEDAWPNSANVNLYRDGRQAVGWHADDESLFRGRDSDCPIVSISLGTPREFWIALKTGDGMEPDPRTVVEADLRDGDLLTMEGRLQRHCVHLVPKANPREPIRDERINITFRWVREHRFHCPLNKRRKVPLPRALRGLFGEAQLRRSGVVDGEDRGLQKALPFLGPPYVRCWSREVLHGVLVDPERMELRLCDGCKHICTEEGRLCCEGRDEWEGRWFCRKCWAKWENTSVPEVPPHLPLTFADAQAQHSRDGSLAWDPTAALPWWPDSAPWWPQSLGFGTDTAWPKVGHTPLSPHSPPWYAPPELLRPWPPWWSAPWGPSAAPWPEAGVPSPVEASGGDFGSQAEKRRGNEEIIKPVAALFAKAREMELSAAPGMASPAAATPDAALDARATESLPTMSPRSSNSSQDKSPDTNSSMATSPSPPLVTPPPAAEPPVPQSGGPPSTAISSDDEPEGIAPSSSVNVGSVLQDAQSITPAVPPQPEPPSPPPQQPSATAPEEAAALPSQDSSPCAPLRVPSRPASSSSEREKSCFTEAVQQEEEVGDGHPLASSWFLWLLMDREACSWEDAQRRVHGPVASVEEFWQLLRHIHPPSAICDADYSFFQEGTSPAREDPELQHGGRWILAATAGGPEHARGCIPEAQFSELVDQVWSAVLLALVGGRFADACASAQVSGAVISMRGQALTPPSSASSVPATSGTRAKLALWLRNAADREEVQAVGRLFHEVLSHATAELVAPRGWKLAFEDFQTRAVTFRI